MYENIVCFSAGNNNVKQNDRMAYEWNPIYFYFKTILLYFVRM